MKWAFYQASSSQTGPGGLGDHAASQGGADGVPGLFLSHWCEQCLKAVGHGVYTL